MKKNVFIFAIACSFFMCLETYSMWDDDDHDPNAHDKLLKPYTPEELATIQLVGGKDPYRFGDLKTNIALSEEDSNAIAHFKTNNTSHAPNTNGSLRYPHTRNLLAIALTKPEKKNEAMRNEILKGACDLNDYHLANSALQSGAKATIIGGSGVPLIQAATSLAMLNLLLIHGAELHIDRIGGSSMIHEACYRRYDPAVLELYLNKFPGHVNRICFGQTPLEKAAFVDVVEKTDLVTLLQKFSLLIGAGATFSLARKSGINALEYIRKKINENTERAMNRPTDSKEALEYVLQASLYKEIEMLLLAESSKSKKDENEKS